MFTPKIRSRHKSHSVIRGRLPRFPFRVIVRFGSSTKVKEVFPKLNGARVVEINTVEAVKNSASKLLMKTKFQEASIKTCNWTTGDTAEKVLQSLTVKTKEGSLFPLVAKHIYGSRGTGNFLLNDKKAFVEWCKGKTMSNYIFEEYFAGTREYRLHVSKNGCFYSCRKMLMNDVPKENRWFRNDSNSVWIIEGNAAFDKPVNWKVIEAECVKAMEAVGLDFSAMDVRVQSAKDDKGRKRSDCDFRIIETNSAPSFGEITKQKYMEELPKIIAFKNEK